MYTSLPSIQREMKERKLPHFFFLGGGGGEVLVVQNLIVKLFDTMSGLADTMAQT